MRIIRIAVVPVCFVLSHLFRLLPLKQKDILAGAIWRVLHPMLKMVGALQRLAIATGNIQQGLSVDTEAAPGVYAEIPDAESEEISVLYSGGADSTYSAYQLAGRFRKVHLLTFAHLGTHDGEPPKINVRTLQDIYGPEKIEHHFIDVDEFCQAIYNEKLKECLDKYGLFAQLFCGPCKLGMHAAAIVFNAEHGIRYTTSGAHMEGAGVWIGQMVSVRKQILEPLFERFGQQLLPSPAFYIENTDEVLYEMGLTTIRHTKFPRYDFTYQDWCNFMVQHNIYARGVFMQLRPQAELEKLGVDFSREKIPFIIERIESEIGSAGAAD